MKILQPKSQLNHVIRLIINYSKDSDKILWGFGLAKTHNNIFKNTGEFHDFGNTKIMQIKLELQWKNEVNLPSIEGYNLYVFERLVIVWYVG